MTSTHGKVTAHPARWQWVELDAITVGERLREVSPAHVARLQASYERLGVGGQIQPIVVDEHSRLIDGAHRVAAAKRAGWQGIGAMVVTGVEPDRKVLLELEANLVRKNLSLREREEAWSAHYEPIFREQAKSRQRAGLRRGVVPGRAGRDQAVKGETLRAPTLARAARQTTGLSIDTLRRIAEIRNVATSEHAPAALRIVAQAALERLDRPGASVTALHRRVREAREQLGQPGHPAKDLATVSAERTLERTVDDAARLCTRLEGGLAAVLTRAANADQAHADHLRALRVALARSLAVVMAVECGLTAHPTTKLRALGHEVETVLSATSLQQLRKQGDLA